MKRVIFILSILLLSLFGSGCFSFETATLTGSGEETVFCSNYGWYLFHYIPIATGNANDDEFLPVAFFRNDAQMDKIQGKLRQYAEKKNRVLSDMAYHNYESVMFNIPGFDLQIPIPYVLTFREVQLSGVLK